MNKLEQIQEWLRKYLFWCLCGLVVLLGGVAWYMGTTQLGNLSKKNLSVIDEHFTTARNISNVRVTAGNIHPNEDVNTQLDNLRKQALSGINKTWKELYDKQAKTIYQWPATLGKEFLDWLKNNPVTEEIPSNYLEDYQNHIKLDFRRLVEQVAMAEWPESLNPMSATGTAASLNTAAGTGTTTSSVDQRAPGINPKLIWDETDILAHRARYNWRERPTSTQVRLAQEDFWVMEQLLSVVTRVNTQTVNNGKAVLFPPHERPIKVLERLAIECFAAEERPLGTGENRIFMPTASTDAAATPLEGGGAEGTTPPPDGGSTTPIDSAAGTPLSAPPARRGAGPGGAGGGGGSELAAREAPPESIDSAGTPPSGETTEPTTAKPDDELYNWRYVDDKSKPLSKSELDTTQRQAIARAMPFQLRMHIVQSAVPKLFEELKNSPLPIEIRQYRENFEFKHEDLISGATSSGGLDAPLGGMSNALTGTHKLLPGEIILELRGVVYLIRPFDKDLLTTGSAAEAGTAGDGSGVPTPDDNR